jgi:hypothetical protein
MNNQNFDESATNTKNHFVLVEVNIFNKGYSSTL